MAKLIKEIIILICLVAILVLPYFVFARSSVLDELKSVGEQSGPYQSITEESNLGQTVGLIISAALSLLGVVFIVLMVYAGYNWMIARGEEEKVNLAKDTIKRAIIGLIITVGAFAIWNFIYTFFLVGS